MTNEQKIELIRGYLSKPNCAGVEVEWVEPINILGNRKAIFRYFSNRGDGWMMCEPVSGFRPNLPKLVDHTFIDGDQIIGDPKPIAIDLGPLKVGDRVWAGGEMGEILYIDYTDSRPYTVKINGDKRTNWERHQLIKAEE